MIITLSLNFAHNIFFETDGMSNTQQMYYYNRLFN